MAESDIHILIVINSYASKGSAGKVYTDYSKFLQDRDIRFSTYFTVGQGDSANIEELLQNQQFTTISILGGEGTNNSVINARGVEKLNVHLIPCGTGNDLANSLLGKKDIKKYFDQSISGKTMEIDMYKCNDRRFLVSFGVGFDAAVCEKIETMRNSKLPRFLSYWVALVSIIFNYPNLKVEIDGVKTSLFLLSLANNDKIGGGFRIAPKARVNDKELEFVLVKPATIKQRLLNLLSLKNGTHLGLDIIEYKRVNSCFIHAQRSIPAHADGELLRDKDYHIEFEAKLRLCI